MGPVAVTGLLFTALLNCGSQLGQGLIMQPLAGSLLANTGGRVGHVRRHFGILLWIVGSWGVQIHIFPRG